MIHMMLPAYNVAGTLSGLLDSIRQVEWADAEPYSVVVVDDGSTDATVSICRSNWDLMPLEVSCHLTRRGPGETMMTGLKHCLSRCGSDDVVISIDAAGTSVPSIVPSLVRKVRSGSDIAIASRYAPGGHVIGPCATRILSRCASAILRVGFGVPGARDYTCGYRAYSAAILERGFNAFADFLVQQKDGLCNAELLIKLSSIGARVSEAPLVVRYHPDLAPAGAETAASIFGCLRMTTLGRPRLTPKDSAEGLAEANSRDTGE